VTTFDDLPVEVRRDCHGWFGEPWGACYDDDDNLRADMRKPFPVGESCVYCLEPFDEAAGDRGQAIPCLREDGTTEIGHSHRECLFVRVIGPLAHYVDGGHCRCQGGDGRVPGMSLREEAVEVWRRFTGRRP